MIDPVLLQASETGLKRLNEHAYERRLAQDMFANAFRNGQFKRIGKLFRGGTRQLKDLNETMSEITAERPSQAHTQHYEGVQEVSLTQIKGSEGRVHDFDIDFNPMHEYVEQRWVNVATAQLIGVPLPPVELVRIGETYFVRDGHHRISVARALKQPQIDAAVVTFEN
jgi:hypothetical protein